MCRMASFFHHPTTGEILVYDLNSHGKTEEHFGLNPAGPYREGHYLPSGKIECRVEDEDGISQETCNELLKSRFPTFLSFFRWALVNGGVIGKELYLSELTELDEEGLEIPNGVKCLYLDNLETVEGLVIPEGVTYLSLDGLETAEGLVIPKSVEVLYLNGLKTVKGLVIPKGVKWLYLYSLETAKGLTVGKNTVVFAFKLSAEEYAKIKRI